MNHLILILMLAAMNLACVVNGQLSGGLRIISGLTANQGRLEIYRYGEWGTVCDYHFDNNDAEEACRQLGYCSGIMHPAHMIDDGIGAIWLNQVNCTGAESTLLQCAYNADSLHCSHHEDVGIHCFLSCSSKDEGDLRITEGFAENKGRLEIKYKGEWGTVCDNQFENVDAEVACRQLGYCSGMMLPAHKVDDGIGTVWLNNVNCSGTENELLNCTFNIDASNCRHYGDVGIHCFLNCSTKYEGGLRITDGFAENQGRLEIKYKGEWGTVCDNQFDNVDAEVACSQLGYCSGFMIPANKVDDGIGTIWLNNVNCSGSESELLNCTFNTDASNCRHYGDVCIHCFLNCSPDGEGGLRITDGFAGNRGRLEIYYKGEWGTLCDDQFENVDAEVACRQLGYCSGLKLPSNKVHDGIGTIWLNNVICSGSESNLLNCTYNHDISPCRHYHDVGIHCFLNCSTEDEGGLRIIDGFAENQGRLEMYYKGEWGTLCDDQFENVDADVACRQLGYCSGLKLPSNKVHDGIGTIWLNNVNCSGSENNLLNCTYNHDISPCRHYNDVGIHCFLNCSTEAEGDLRITDGFATNQGRLEIYYKGEWGTLCDNQFENVDAEVACRQLGHCSGLQLPSNKVNDGIGTVWFNNVNCFGSESNLLNCTYNHEISPCRHYNDVGIHCFLNCSTEAEGDLRIIKGHAANQGRLEINYKGEWGTVCDNEFENVDAKVACRQLGYCSGLMLPAHKVDDGIGTIWLNHVNCSGSEGNLLNCSYNHDISPCRHYQDIGVHCFLNCSTGDEGGLRITDGVTENQGRLETYYKGEWGTVCDNQFHNVDAEVACRQLGYCSGQMIPAVRIKDGQGTIWLNDVNCSGSESELLNCTYTIDTSNCRHSEDVGIHCFLICSIEDEELQKSR